MHCQAIVLHMKYELQMYVHAYSYVLWKESCRA